MAKTTKTKATKKRKTSAARKASAAGPAIGKDKAGQMLLLVLGSGPAIAVLDSMLAQAQANGIMYHNAVQQQQLTNILGMVDTMKAVEILLDPPKKKR